MRSALPRQTRQPRSHRRERRFRGRLEAVDRLGFACGDKAVLDIAAHLMRRAIVRPIRDRPLTDLADLLKRIRRLEAHGLDVTVYPDAEEYLQTQLLQQRIAATVADIRRDPKAHPLRKTLLKVELLPYQLDGIAFAAGVGRLIVTLPDETALANLARSLAALL